MAAVERNLASLEQALSLEIQRRIDLESRITSQVEAGLRQAVRSATGLVEEQLATAQQKQGDELRVRLLALERSVGSLQHRFSQEEFGKPAERPKGDHRERQMAWLESRMAALEVQKPLEMPLEVSRQLQLIRSELMNEAATRWQDVAQLMRGEIDDSRQRVDALERWLREAVAPEVVRLQLDLASERRCREQLENKVVHTNQRSPRVPPVNKATWSFESMLPRERKPSLKAPPQQRESAQTVPPQKAEEAEELDGARIPGSQEPERKVHENAQSRAASTSEPRESVKEQDAQDMEKETKDAKVSVSVLAPVEQQGAAQGSGDEPRESVEDAEKIESVQSEEFAASASSDQVPRPRALLGRMRRSLKER